MSVLISRSKELFLAWLAMGFWFLFFTITSLGAAIVCVSYTMRWQEVDTQDKVIACILILINWGQTMMALMQKVSARLTRGEFPIENGDTQLISRTAVAISSTTEKTPGT